MALYEGDSPYLQLDWKEGHGPIFLQEFAHSGNVLVGIANDLQHRNQLGQADGEILRHPAFACHASCLLSLLPACLLLFEVSPFLHPYTGPLRMPELPSPNILGE